MHGTKTQEKDMDLYLDYIDISMVLELRVSKCECIEHIHVNVIS